VSGLTAGRPVTARDAFVQALADIQLTGEHTRDVVNALLKVVEPAHAPAKFRTIRLTATRWWTDELATRTAKSFTVVNPQDFSVRVGVGGISAGNIAALPIPPKSTMTVPTAADDLEIAAHPDDLAAGDVYLFVFLYDAPQAFFFASEAA
jgi:hypothetical protein